MLQCDMWYGHTFEPGKYWADAYFNGEVYAGNIYGWQGGPMIGDYMADSSDEVERNFKIDWRD